MKLKIIVILSLLLNAALAGAYFYARPKAPAVQQVSSQNAAPQQSSALRSRPSRITEVILATNQFSWANLESPDYREYIANLRAIGTPEETIKDIIIADVNKLYAARMMALYPSPKDFKFWRVEDRSARTEQRSREQQRRDLEKEKRELLKDLLGIDYEHELQRLAGRPDEDAWRLGFLSPEKQQALETLQSKYRELERTLMAEGRGEGGGRGGFSPEARAKMAALRAQREAEMAQVLGPQDYQEYQLRNSWTARNMRENLATFQPSEEEFRKIFELRKTYEDQFGFTREGGDEQLREQRRLAQQQLEEQMKATLGEERWNQYQLAQDDRYREIYDFVQRSNLPEDKAMTVYDMRKAVEDTRQRVANDPNMTPEVKQATLAEIANQTKTTLAQVLGDQAYKDYIQRDGRWAGRIDQMGAGGERGGRGRDSGGFAPGGPGGPQRGRFDRRN